MSDERKLPLSTLEQALDYFETKKLEGLNEELVNKVNDNFSALLRYIWHDLPSGPGKTIAIRKLKEANMACVSCIVNDGI